MDNQSKRELNAALAHAFLANDTRDEMLALEARQDRLVSYLKLMYEVGDYIPELRRQLVLEGDLPGPMQLELGRVIRELASSTALFVRLVVWSGEVISRHAVKAEMLPILSGEALPPEAEPAEIPRSVD